MTNPKGKHPYLYRNGLTIVFSLLFVFTLGAQAVTGWKEHNQDSPGGIWLSIFVQRSTNSFRALPPLKSQ
jgi:hypothetical protein